MLRTQRLRRTVALGLFAFLAAPLQASWAGPVLVGDHLVLVSSEGEVVKVAPQSGAVLDTKKLGGGSVVSPIVADETIYVLSE